MKSRYTNKEAILTFGKGMMQVIVSAVKRFRERKEFPIMDI